MQFGIAGEVRATANSPALVIDLTDRLPVAGALVQIRVIIADFGFIAGRDAHMGLLRSDVAHMNCGFGCEAMVLLEFDLVAIDLR